MKLNNKGYMLVEIIIASVLAMTIAYYLINLTYNFKNTSEDIYQSYYYINDKNLITKNIMFDLEKKSITSPISTPTSVEFNVYDSKSNPQAQKRKLEVIKGDKTTIKYGKVTASGNFDIEDVSYYEKELEPTLTVGDIEVAYDDTSITINIPITAIYDDTDYSIKLYANTYISSVN